MIPSRSLWKVVTFFGKDHANWSNISGVLIGWSWKVMFGKLKWVFLHLKFALCIKLLCAWKLCKMEIDNLTCDPLWSRHATTKVSIVPGCQQRFWHWHWTPGVSRWVDISILVCTYFYVWLVKHNFCQKHNLNIELLEVSQDFDSDKKMRRYMILATLAVDLSL